MLRFFLALPLMLATIPLVHAEECKPLAEAQKKIEAQGGGQFKMMSHDQLLFARGLYVMTPPASPYPPGEYAMISEFKSGGVVVLFLEGEKSCAQIGFSARVGKLLIDLDKSI